MIDKNKEKVEVKEGAPKMPLGVAMDMAEYAVKGKSAQDREKLENDLVAKDKLKPASDKKEKSNLTPQQKEIIEKLNAAKGAEERVRVFAKIADDIGLDALVSLIPGLGDAGSSILSGLYLLCEAKKAGLGKISYVKIIQLQALDFAIGAIPVVGDVADYFFKANKWSASSFEKKTKEIVKEARKAGIPEEEIAKITASAEKLPKLVGHAVDIYKGVKGKKSKEVTPKTGA